MTVAQLIGELQKFDLSLKVLVSPIGKRHDFTEAEHVYKSEFSLPKDDEDWPDETGEYEEMISSNQSEKARADNKSIMKCLIIR